MAEARDERREDYHVVAIVGDSALASGMAQEALNNAGHAKTRLIVVLNDNAMSISPALGTLTGLLNRVRLSAPYRVAKTDVEPILAQTPLVGRPIHEVLRRWSRGVKAALTPAAMFEQLGFEYLGPIDGHDIGTLLFTLSHAMTMDKPVIVHALTVKGKGYAPAEADQQKWHSVTPFDIATGEIARPVVPAKSFTHYFAETMLELGESDHRVVAVTAGMTSGTMLEEFARRWPDRFFDVGIAEEHAVAFAAGLANAGQRPVVAIYSTFLQRAFDQIVHDVCLQEVPVVFAVDRAGLVGEDGTTHHGAFDLTYLCAVPNMTVMAPRDGAELQAMLREALTMELPVAVRWPRGAAPERTSPLFPKHRSGGSMLHSEVMRPGGDVLLYAAGVMANVALEAADLLDKSGIWAGVVNARAVKPIDERTLSEQLRGRSMLFTLEESSVRGGFGAQVALALADLGLAVPQRFIGLPDSFVEHGSQKGLRELLGLDAKGVAAQVAGALRRGLPATAGQ
jgi:1-deoxy-D-xylulose-5-phosphate synthase